MALRRSHLTVAGLYAGAPLALAFVLGMLRPDLMSGLLKHVLAPVLVIGLLAICAFTGALLLFGFWLVDQLDPARRKLRTALNLAAGLVVFVAVLFPTAFGVMFAPVLIAMQFPERAQQAEAETASPPVDPADSDLQPVGLPLYVEE